MASFNWVDYIVLVILFLSIGAGMLRGFVREIIAVVSWVIGIFIASKFAGSVASYFTSSSNVQSTLSSATNSIGFDTAQPVSYLAIGISFVCIFVLVLIIGKIFSYFFSGAVQLTGLGFLNSLLGGLFGLIRGILFTVILMYLIQLTPLGQESYWAESRFVNIFQPAVQWMNAQSIPSFQRLKIKAGETWQNMNNNLHMMSGVYQKAP